MEQKPIEIQIQDKIDKAVELLNKQEEIACDVLCDEIFEMINKTYGIFKHDVRVGLFQNSIYWKIVHISEQKNVEWVYQKEVIQKELDSLEAIEGIRYHPLRIVNGIRGLERRKLVETKKNGQGEILVRAL